MLHFWYHPNYKDYDIWLYQFQLLIWNTNETLKMIDPKLFIRDKFGKCQFVVLIDGKYVSQLLFNLAI